MFGVGGAHLLYPTQQLGHMMTETRINILSIRLQKHPGQLTIDQGPVVQNFVSLTSSLRPQLIKMLTT